MRIQNSVVVTMSFVIALCLFSWSQPSVAFVVPIVSPSSFLVGGSGNSLGHAQQQASSSRSVSPSRASSSSSSSLHMSATGPIVKWAVKSAAAAATAAVLGTATVKLVLDRPSRPYGEGTVANEYDEWMDDGVLEYYWGEHIHLGYYSPKEMAAGYRKKNFIQAKYDFIDEMMKLGNVRASDFRGTRGAQVLDVGCGFGGTTRYLAKKLGPTSNVTGITLSPRQVLRARELALDQDVSRNTNFVVMDALQMEFPDNTFDVVWACESGEHMPDKKKYIDEMMRVLKPGGTFVMACWCQRDDTHEPFDERDLRDLKYLYEEWTHPYFVSIKTFRDLIHDTGVMENIVTENWVNQTIASWRHSIWVGIEDPFGWITKPRVYYKCVRDGYCLERMHRAFKRGLMEYGMFTATKKK